jgi:hypothetical protein
MQFAGSQRFEFLRLAQEPSMTGRGDGSPSVESYDIATLFQTSQAQLYWREVG